MLFRLYFLSICDESWKFQVVCMGITGDLAFLSKQFGILIGNFSILPFKIKITDIAIIPVWIMEINWNFQRSILLTKGTFPESFIKIGHHDVILARMTSFFSNDVIKWRDDVIKPL